MTVGRGFSRGGSKLVCSAVCEPQSRIRVAEALSGMIVFDVFDRSIYIRGVACQNHIRAKGAGLPSIESPSVNSHERDHPLRPGITSFGLAVASMLSAGGAQVDAQVQSQVQAADQKPGVVIPSTLSDRDAISRRGCYPRGSRFISPQIFNSVPVSAHSFIQSGLRVGTFRSRFLL